MHGDRRQPWWLCERRVAAAPFGGPIAVTRAEGLLLEVSSSGSVGGGSVVQIYSAAGKLQGAAVWGGGRVAGMGWTEGEELMVMDDCGKVGTSTQCVL